LSPKEAARKARIRELKKLAPAHDLELIPTPARLTDWEIWRGHESRHYITSDEPTEQEFATLERLIRHRDQQVHQRLVMEDGAPEAGASALSPQQAELANRYLKPSEEEHQLTFKDHIDYLEHACFQMLEHYRDLTALYRVLRRAHDALEREREGGRNS
jgi:hypothetical protein